MANETPEQRAKWKELANAAKQKQNADFSSLDIETDDQFEGSVFDYVEYVTDNFLKEGNFLVDQQKLHSMNALTGHIFNPLGLYASINGGGIDTGVDPAMDQLFNQLGSDILGGGGAYDTTDGKTFSRVADNDAHSLFFHSVRDFANEVSDGTNLGDKLLNSAVNTLGQAVGIDASPTRSIMAQALAYRHTDFVPYSDEEGSSTGAEFFTPIGNDAQSYIYGNKETINQELVSSIFGVGQDESVGQNYRIKKDDSIVNVGKTTKKSIFKSFLNSLKENLSRTLLGTNIFSDRGGEYYINWTKEDSEYLTSFYSAFFDEKTFSDFEHQIDKEDGFASPNKISEDDAEKLSKDNIYDHFLGATGVETGERKIPINPKQPEYNFKQYKTESYVKSKTGFREIVEKNLDSIKEYDPTKYGTDTESGINVYGNNNQGYMGDYGNNNSENIAQIYKMTGEAFNSNNSFKKFNEREIESDLIIGSDILEEATNDFDDVVFMSFQDVRNDKIIYLRPTVESISDAYQIAQGGENMYIGRTEPIPEYQQTTRNISLSFYLYCRTPREYLLNLKKMDFLRSLAYPEAISPTNYTTVKNPLFRFTLGDQYKNIGGAMNSLTFDPDTNSTWEMSKGFVGAKIINVSVSFSVVHDRMPMLYKGNEFDTTREDDTQFTQTRINYSEELANGISA